jgi:hypothetical protein
MDSIPENAKIRLKEIMPGFGAYGFNLHGKYTSENILLANKTAIIVKYSEELNYLIAIYDFDPEDSALDELRYAFDKVKVIAIRHSLQGEASVQNYHRIPQWINRFRNLECLVLNNVDLQDESGLGDLQLKLLWIHGAKFDDVRKLVQAIGKIEALEFLMCDSGFSKEHISELKEKLPRLTFFQSGKI